MNPTALFRSLVVPLVGVSLLSAAVASDEIPGAPQSRPIVLIGGTVHPVSGPSLVADVLFDGGRIVRIGRRIPAPEGAERIDVSGKHVYPGLFDAWTDIGLVEISSVPGSRDESETGAINPNAASWVAVNPDSEHIPVARANGVLLALSAPAGGLIPGCSAILELDGWTWEDMALRAPSGLHIDWPRVAPIDDWLAPPRAREAHRRRDAALEEIARAFADARAWGELKRLEPDVTPRDARWEAMQPILDGKVPAIIHADDLGSIESAVAFALRERIRIIIAGGYDAPHAAGLLKEHGIPVIVGGVYRRPARRSDEYDAAYTLPERLRRAGVQFCISGGNPSSSSQVRNLPYHAATAVAFGLSREEAIRAITLYPAQILGVSERVGSLAPGKDATLIVTDGNPLETKTRVELAWIEGRRVDLSNRHVRLWKKYQEKYDRLEEATAPAPSEVATPAAEPADTARAESSPQ
ncbi:MAG TPA: amidohydrolase family protein [Planctomycetota bacterium]|nr:amidohydrolase family protein [Planctomycetota bacterium]